MVGDLDRLVVAQVEAVQAAEDPDRLVVARAGAVAEVAVVPVAAAEARGQAARA